MSLVSNLVKNNITFKFDGSKINVDTSNCDKLVECKIPFSFTDGKIEFGEVKKDVKIISTGLNNKNPIKVIETSLMRTIYNLLVKTNKFIMGVMFDEEYTRGKERKNIILQYEGKMCTLKLYENKFVMEYESWDAVINFTSPWENINHMIPNYIDGLVLMIIAGFDYKIIPNSWAGFDYSYNQYLFQISYNEDGQKYFVLKKNKASHITNNLDMAIELLEKFK